MDQSEHEIKTNMKTNDIHMNALAEFYIWTIPAWSLESMSSIEYSALLHRTVSQGINWATDGETLLLLCERLIAAGSENSIQNAASLFKELEKENNLGIDHLDILKEILRGMQKWSLIDEVEKFQVRRQNYVSLQEKIISKLDEYDVRRLIEICGRQHLAADREGDINDAGTLFKELENENRSGAHCLRIFKKILKETGEEDLLKEVETFERKKKKEDLADRQRVESEMRRGESGLLPSKIDNRVSNTISSHNIWNE